MGEYAQADAAQTEQAIAAARAAAPAWAIVQRAGARRHARQDRQRDPGAQRRARHSCCRAKKARRLPEGVGEVARAGNIFKFFAGEVLRRTGELVPSVRPGVDVEVTREPVGVVGIISPWNFPAAIPAWKIAPALAYGNCVVFKPADLVPGSAWAMAEIISRAGAAGRRVQPGDGPRQRGGRSAGQRPRVDAISFTGSVETGQKIAQKAVARMAKFQLEMGGKNPLVVLDDADLKTAVESAVNGAFFSTGQRCTASSRLIVTKGIHNKFVEALIERVKAMPVDNALKAGTQMGPVVDKNQLNQDLFYIEEGKKEGAKLAYGGNLLKRETEGFYLEPALFTETSNSMRINREEVFGPVATRASRRRITTKRCSSPTTRRSDLSAGIVTDLAQARGAFPPQQPGRHGDGESAHRGRGLSRAVRRPQGFQLWPARAGPLCGGVLHDGEDGVRRGAGLSSRSRSRELTRRGRRGRHPSHQREPSSTSAYSGRIVAHGCAHRHCDPRRDT